MLELKLKNQKDRYDQIVNREESRLKNTENNHIKDLSEKLKYDNLCKVLKKIGCS